MFNRLKLLVAFLLPRWLVQAAALRMLNYVCGDNPTKKDLANLRFMKVYDAWKIGKDCQSGKK